MITGCDAVIVMSIMKQFNVIYCKRKMWMWYHVMGTQHMTWLKVIHLWLLVAEQYINSYTGTPRQSDAACISTCVPHIPSLDILSTCSSNPFLPSISPNRY